MKRAVIMHQKLVRTEQDLYEGPATAQASKTIDLHCQEAVRFVTIVPETWSGASFNLTVKMKHSVVGGKGVSLSEEELFCCLVCVMSFVPANSSHTVSEYTVSEYTVSVYSAYTISESVYSEYTVSV